MSKNKKQFGVWMDAHHAIVVGKNADNESFAVLGHVDNTDATGNSSEKNENNSKKGNALKFFKEVTALMQNAEEVHVTGTGDTQEQFMKHLSETPQFKNTVSSETTSNKMSDENFVKFISEKYN